MQIKPKIPESLTNDEQSLLIWNKVQLAHVLEFSRKAVLIRCRATFADYARARVVWSMIEGKIDSSDVPGHQVRVKSSMTQLWDYYNCVVWVSMAGVLPCSTELHVVVVLLHIYIMKSSSNTKYGYFLSEIDTTGLTSSQ